MKALDASLERAWLRQLAHRWRQLNHELLNDRLRPPTFSLDDATQRLGSWHGDTRTLTLSRHHILDAPWREVVETLRHEMAHQVADELLGGHERPHGEVFKRACAMLQISSGEVSEDASEAKLRKILDRVQKLMALAESDNPHEAQLAMSLAHRNLLKVHLSPEQLQTDHRYLRRVLGRSAAALPLSWKLVGNILEEFFFVQCVWVTTYNPRRDRMERELEVSGRPADVDMAAWVHDFLHAESERLWRRARERGQASGAAGRRDFCVGVLLGFRDKLRAERETCEATGLVWVGDSDLQAFVERRHPRLRSLGGGGVRRNQALAEGRREGNRLTLRRPVAPPQQRGRLTDDRG